MGKVVRKKSDAASHLKLALGIDGYTSKVGWFESAKYEDGTPVAGVAAVHEFGSGNVPPRPFMRPTAKKESAQWGKIAGSGTRAILAGNASPSDVMDGLGLAAEGDIRKTISQIQEPPLAPATIRAKQSKLADKNKVGNLSKPLVETGLMIASLTSVTEK